MVYERRRDISPQEMGGIIQRFKSLEDYYKNPNFCKYCGSIILVLENQQPSTVRKKKFCGHSCSAKYNNFGNEYRNTRDKIGVCEFCGDNFEQPIRTNGSVAKNQFCSNQCLSLGRRVDREMTKEEIFNKYDGWRNARGVVTKDAKRVFEGSDMDYECMECGYEKHIEVCHIKDVSDFSSNSTLGDINAESNLIPLCPNHHWEFDNDHLSIGSGS